MRIFTIALLFTIILPLTSYAVWHQLADIPEAIESDGEGIVYGGGYVWTIAGEDGDVFYAYDVSQSSPGDVWVKLEDFPGCVDEEVGDIEYEYGYDRRIFVVDEYGLYLYTKDYETGYDGEWEEPIDLPDYEFYAGTCITFQYNSVGAYTGYLYLLRGGGERANFFRRKIDVPDVNPRSPQQENGWEELDYFPEAPNAGASMCYNCYEGIIYAFPGGDEELDFYSYSIASDEWSECQETPAYQKVGSSITNNDRLGDNLWAVFGNDDTYQWYYYDIGGDEWGIKDHDMPDVTGYGADITRKRERDFYLALGGGSAEFYRHSTDEEEGKQSLEILNLSQKTRVVSYSDRFVINYTIGNPTSIRIQVFNLSGEMIKTLFQGKMEKGNHQISWDKTDGYGEKAPSGIYFITIDSGNTVDKLKAIISK